ncbi:DUF485 domain-containing protein [Micromonospora sp. RTGN7]|uniref:DUF485 domain-containing protein n=1 Tax=Micromonospora sp. RTGN7 TaxID=3016526 RepID=UPI0029FF1AAD|nr:DUF485 domain-containing protein [Micromonospora sp. RTGN7]
MSTETPAPDKPPTATETPVPAASTAERYLAVQRSDEFAGLRRTLRGFIFPMTVAFFLWYALYVILSAYARDFMGTRLFGSHINVALVFGLLQFVSTFLIAWLYSRFADRKIDPVADRIRAEIGEVRHEHGPRG